ncbi:MAG: tyrosine-type recombinase/integrase [Clostridia bacterium]|nr:tyrosine-type recombinase/integrase [Clostridia bacterium]
MVSAQAEDCISEFIQSLSENEDLNQKTLREYTSDLRNFAHWFEETWSIHREGTMFFHPSEIITPIIVQYREYLQKIRCLKPATVNRRLNTLKRYFYWAACQGLVSIDYSKPIKLIPEKKTSPRQMTDKEEAALMVTAEKHGTVRDRTLLLMMLHTGLRSMEVCNLTVKDVTIGKRSGHITVRAGKRNKQREVPLNSTVRTALEPYLASLPHGCEYLFPSEKTGGRLNERALRHIVEKYSRLAGLNGLSAHDLRHRFGYVMSEKTPLHRLSQIMGHDSLNTTMVYVRATRADLQSEVEKIAWQ